MPLEFVNVHGELWAPSAESIKPRKPPKREGPAEFHKGWRVEGIPPGALEQAEKSHPQIVAEVVSWNERVSKEPGLGKARPVPGPWDATRWLNEAKARPVRAKPYSVEAAAQECKRLAELAGWLRVSIVEVKREKETS